MANRLSIRQRRARRDNVALWGLAAFAILSVIIYGAAFLYAMSLQPLYF